MNKLKALGIAALAAFSFASAAHADVTGTVYLDVDSPTDASVLPSSSKAHADFTTTSINFNTNCSDCTSIADFLNNPVFSNLQNGFNSSHLTDNSFILINAFAFLNSGNNSFVVGHDDGVVLTFPGLNGGAPIVNQPGPTGNVETPFDVNNPGPAGLYAFTLQYTECCGGPANLNFTVNDQPPVSAVPEPSTWAMMVLGFAGVGFMAYRRRKTAALAA